MNKSVEDRYAKAARRGYDTGKQSTGSKPAPKPKISLKGTNPLKGKVAVTKTWKF
jgi:hypothetical protein